MTETFADGLPSDIRRMADVVMRAACDRNMMVSVAESCTGGLFAALLTDVEGASHAFDRGFISYTDMSKKRLLGVSSATLANESAVSVASAEDMVLGALQRSMADLALSITGYAGRGGPGEEPGLVYFGLARRNYAPSIVERHFGDIGRSGVRLECLRTGLELLSTILN